MTKKQIIKEIKKIVDAVKDTSVDYISFKASAKSDNSILLLCCRSYKGFVITEISGTETSYGNWIFNIGLSFYGRGCKAIYQEL